MREEARSRVRIPRRGAGSPLQDRPQDRGDRPMVKADAAERFLAAPLLDDVDRDSRRAVLNVLTEDRATVGAILMREGEPNDLLSFLIEGSALIERTLPDGRKEILANLTAPAVFGTTSFFRPNPPTVTVRATT